MKGIAGWAPVALGMATLGSLSMTAPLISRTHTTVYHLDGSAEAVFVSVAVDAGLLFVLVAALLLWAERTVLRQRLVWSCLLVVLPAMLLRNGTSLAGSSFPRMAWLLATLVPLGAVVMAWIFWPREGAKALERARDLLTTMFGVCSIFGLLIAAQLVWFGWRARDLNPTAELHQRVGMHTPTARHRRVIWILLDELSYQQVYERRFPGLGLPAFDRMAAGATVFTKTVPAGNFTEVAVPSLMMGRRVDELSITADGPVRTFHDGDINAWLPFDPRQTVFEDALAQGYSTGIAGWYNPYCRILPSVLDRCFWTSESPLHGHMYSERSVLSNVVAPLDSLASAARQGVDPERSSMHALDYQTLVVAGDELLKDSSCDFIFLHMPIPHPGGIFDRRRMKFTTAGASYVDNLALADAYLAHVRGLLERRGDWDSSTVVVMGDHSWRTKLMWEGSPEWTAEDEAASHGGEFDDRPAYIVKLAGQQTGATINAPFAATRTRALLDGILAGRLHSVEDLKAWVGQAQH